MIIKNVVHQRLDDALAAIRNEYQERKILQMRKVVEIDHDTYNEIKETSPGNQSSRYSLAKEWISLIRV